MKAIAPRGTPVPCPDKRRVVPTDHKPAERSGKPSDIAMLAAGPGRLRRSDTLHPFVRGVSKREVRLFQVAFVFVFVSLPIVVDVALVPYAAAVVGSVALRR